MKAITLHQPFATLVMLGYDVKHHETRHWPTRHRGLLGMHAAALVSAEYRQLCATDPHIAAALAAAGLTYDTLPFGALLGTVELRECHEMTQALIDEQMPTERATGLWTVGRYAWQLEDRQPYSVPVPCRGYQQLWNVPREIEHQAIYS